MFTNLKSDNKSDKNAEATGNHAPQIREIICIQCGGHNNVGVKAMSVFCKHCSQRLVVEDFQIKGFHASRSFDTCGDVVVEKRGQLAAFVRAQNLVVKGKVKGDVEARGRIEITRTGEVQGNVTTPSLIVENGGMIDGEVHVGMPPNKPAPETGTV